MRTRLFVYLIAWAWALILLVAAFWSNFSDSQFPLPGTRAFSVSDHRIPMAIFVFASATWYSMPRLVTRNSLLFFSGVSAALGLVGFIYTSVPFGLACFFFSTTAQRTYWSSGPADRVPDHASQ